MGYPAKKCAKCLELVEKIHSLDDKVQEKVCDVFMCSLHSILCVVTHKGKTGNAFFILTVCTNVGLSRELSKLMSMFRNYK